MDYFADLFGRPEPTKRENWEGQEEPIFLTLHDQHISAEDLRKKLSDLEINASRMTGVPYATNQGFEQTIDIDYEEID